MNDLRNIPEKIRAYVMRHGKDIAKYRIAVMFVIIGIAISFALLKTRTFIDIPRNEDRYAEEVLQIRYKSIDETLLEEFKDAQADNTIEVNSNFDPDRSNPFNE